MNITQLFKTTGRFKAKTTMFLKSVLIEKLGLSWSAFISDRLYPDVLCLRWTLFWCALFQADYILMYSDVLCFRRTLFWFAFRRITWTRLSGNRRRWKSRWRTDSCTRSTSTSWWSRSTTSMATTGASSPSCWTAPGRNTFPPGSRTRSSTSGRCISVICCGFSPSRRLGSKQRPWLSGNLQRRRRKWCRILPPLQQPHEEDTRREPSRTVSSSVGPPLSVSSFVTLILWKNTKFVVTGG